METPSEAAGKPKYAPRCDFDGLRIAISAPFASRRVVHRKRHVLHVSPKLSAFDGIIIDSPTPTSISNESSFSTVSGVYDVFINHYGLDVKHTLATNIYKSLRKTALRVFLDKNELELGDFFPLALEEAMRNASIHIAIFSENYAYSPWCLAELAFMMKTRTSRVIFIPIFCHVEPSMVRWTITGKGSYASAFLNHENRYDSQKIHSWKQALHEASFYTGETITNQSDEKKALKNVVNRVLKEIKDERLCVANYPVDGVKYIRHLNKAPTDPHKIGLKLLIWAILQFCIGYDNFLFFCTISWLFVLIFIYCMWWPSPRNWIGSPCHRLLSLLYMLFGR